MSEIEYEELLARLREQIRKGIYARSVTVTIHHDVKTILPPPPPEPPLVPDLTASYRQPGVMLIPPPTRRPRSLLVKTGRALFYVGRLIVRGIGHVIGFPMKGPS